MDSYKQFQKALESKKRNANFAESNKNRVKKLVTELNNLRNPDNLLRYEQNTQTDKQKDTQVKKRPT